MGRKEGIKMKRIVKDGWHNCKGEDIYTENGYIVRGIRKDYNGSDISSYPYRKTKDGSLTSTITGTLDGLRKGYIYME